MTPSKLDDIEHAIEKAAAVALVEVRDDERGGVEFTNGKRALNDVTEKPWP